MRFWPAELRESHNLEVSRLHAIPDQEYWINVLFRYRGSTCTGINHRTDAVCKRREAFNLIS